MKDTTDSKIYDAYKRVAQEYPPGTIEPLKTDTAGTVPPVPSPSKQEVKNLMDVTRGYVILGAPEHKFVYLKKDTAQKAAIKINADTGRSVQIEPVFVDPRKNAEGIALAVPRDYTIVEEDVMVKEDANAQLVQPKIEAPNTPVPGAGTPDKTEAPKPEEPKTAEPPKTEENKDEEPPKEDNGETVSVTFTMPKNLYQELKDKHGLDVESVSKAINKIITKEIENMLLGGSRETESEVKGEQPTDISIPMCDKCKGNPT